MGFWQTLLHYIIQILVNVFERFTNRRCKHVLNKVNYWQLSLDNIEEARTLLAKRMLNEYQCRNLVSHLEELKIISSIENDVHENTLVGVQKDLYRITFNAKVLISECCKEKWLPIAILQYNNREAFRELLMEMDSWFRTMCDIMERYNPNRAGDIQDIRNLTTFHPSSIDDVDGDLLALQEMIDCKRKQSRQVNESQRSSLDMVRFNEAWIGSTSHHEDVLADYMERRIIELRKSFGVEVNISIIPDDYPHPDNQAPLCPLHDFTNVYESKWLGMNCVTKVFSIPTEASSKEMIFNEARTMEGLCHPNIIKLYYCGYSDEGKKFMIVMEQGQMTLSKMLKKYKEEKKKLPEEVKLDIILQIASGMCYMHDMMIAHRDLKLENVVVNTIFPEEVDVEYVRVKLLDFGLSKVKRRDASQVLVVNDNAGTSGYMAPEVFKTDQVNKVDAFKADVFSFSMMCSEILSLEKPFGVNLTLGRYRKEILAGRRPRLGEDCSPELTLLMKSCWSSDPNKRPTFHEILRLVTMMKRTMFQGSLLTTTVVKVNDKIVASNILVGVESKIIILEGILQKVGALGIIGMGGIGKSTLAKALSDHIGHKFEASCYIDDIKHGSCRFMLREDNYNSNMQREVHSLEKGCDILRRVCTTKRTLIVLDDVGPKSPLNTILENMLFDNLNGCKIIATSRTWKSLKRYIPLQGKFDLELLDNNQSLELFSMHASTENQDLSTYLKSIAEKIVSTCNGLPLSLQVIGSQLRGESRLRKWEQTLFRLMQGSKDEVTEKQLWNILQISFDDLSDEEKDMFVDVSCFFCNDSYPSYIHEEDLILIANEDVSISKHSLYNLKDRSLLKIDEDGLVTIHDHLRDMGRRIAHEQQSHYRDLHMATFDECNRQDPQKIKGLSFSRFGHYESHNKRMTSLAYKHLRILIFHLLEDFNFTSELLSHTPSLRCLIIKFSNMDDAIKIVSDTAQILWRIFKYNTLPQVRVLHLDNCNFFEQFPDLLLDLIQLSSLSMTNCNHREINLVKFSNLISLRLKSCSRFCEFSEKPSKLPNHQILRSDECPTPMKISNNISTLTRLKTLMIFECNALEEFPSGLENLIALEELNFSQCRKLKKGPNTFGNLMQLKNLQMWECEVLEEFPHGLENLVALEKLIFSKCRKLKKGPNTFGNLTLLKHLQMWECEALEEFPRGLENLVALEKLSFSKCRKLKKGPNTFGNLSLLKHLQMRECEVLEEFPHGLENLIALEELNFSKCRKLKKGPNTFGNLTLLKDLQMWECEALEEFPHGLENLVALEKLGFTKCRKLKKGPNTFGNLTLLKHLQMRECEALEEFPHGLENLIALEVLNFSKCRKLKKGPNTFGNLTLLKDLQMWECEALEEFPHGVENLVALEKLDFSKCSKLKKGPNTFGNLTRLKDLQM